MTTRWWSVFIILLSGVPFACSKGPVDLILISGGRLNQPIEITAPSSLKAFDPWVGEFADWQQKPLSAQPPALDD